MYHTISFSFKILKVENQKWTGRSVFFVSLSIYTEIFLKRDYRHLRDLVCAFYTMEHLTILQWIIESTYMYSFQINGSEEQAIPFLFLCLGTKHEDKILNAQCEMEVEGSWLIQNFMDCGLGVIGKTSIVSKLHILLDRTN